VSFDAVQRRWREWLARAGSGPLPTSEWRCPGCGGAIDSSYCLACQIAGRGTFRKPRHKPRPNGRTAERPAERS
jgi:hypothetical protein